MIRQHYAARLAEARRVGQTQDSVAKAGHLAGQTAISKLLANQNLGPSVETFVKAVRGLGLEVSTFFAEIERQIAAPEAPPVEERSVLDRVLDLEHAVAILRASPSSSTRLSSSPPAVGARSAPCVRQPGRPYEAAPVSSSGHTIHITGTVDPELQSFIHARFADLADRLERLESCLPDDQSPPRADRRASTRARGGHSRRPRSRS